MEQTFYKNGKIFTADEAQLFADAMLVKGETILWIGEEKNAPIEANEAQQVDLCGARVIPGLIDAHMHPVLLADCNKQIVAVPMVVKSHDELIQEIKRVRKKVQPGDWILGWGYDEGKYEGKKSPDRYVLDQGCSDCPVVILRTCAHIRACNSMALELAGITKDTKDPIGGEIERDEQGEPTGILKENAGHLIVPFIPAKDRQEAIRDLADLSDLLTSQGITAVCDMGGVDHTDNYQLLKEAATQGFRQKTAVYYMWDKFMDNPEFTITDKEMDRSQQIFAAGLKLIGDGSISGRTAWMNRPYKEEEGNCGMPVYTEEQVETAIAFCKEYHCQLSIHAMGGRAIDRALDRVCIEKPWTPEGIPYVRMEHLTDPSIESMERAAAYGIPWSTQPIFIYAEIDTYMDNLGVEWARTCYPIKTILEKGVQLCFSTDAPATVWAVPSDPYSCIKGAVTRIAYEGSDSGTSQKVDIQTALCLYTREAAKIAGFERIGELKEGYKADFVVLDRDILTIPAEEIDQVKVLKTYINGICEYEI